MEPLIHGRSSPVASDGDQVLIWKSIKVGSLHRGDLVAINFEFEGRPIKTLRQIKYIPGDADPNNAAAIIPADCFYVNASKTNALDSRSFGLVHASQIVGKVIKVFHSR